jgi:hypothetical protein
MGFWESWPDYYKLDHFSISYIRRAMKNAISKDPLWCRPVPD